MRTTLDRKLGSLLFIVSALDLMASRAAVMGYNEANILNSFIRL
jgi:hypothetical protein